MARKYRNALQDKIDRVEKAVQSGTATEEEIAWLQKIDTIKQRKRSISLNPGKETRQKRLKLGQSPNTPHIRRYHHPHSRRGT